MATTMQAAAARLSVKNIAARQQKVPAAAVQMFQYLKEGLKDGAPPALRAKVANDRDPNVRRAEKDKVKKKKSTNDRRLKSCRDQRY